MELRPLGFGEIFDRAITLYIRNFLPFAGIVGVFVVPLAVLQYVVDESSVPQWDQMMQILTHPGKTPPAPVMPAILTSPGTLILFGLLVIALWMLWPFALNACAVGIARLYRGRPVEFVPCYRASLQRWPSVVGLMLVEFCLVLAWYVAFLVVMVLSMAIAIALARLSIAFGVLGGVVAVAFALGTLLTIGPVVVALTFSMNAIVIEEQPVFAALGLGFSRVFNRTEFWRAFLFAIAAGAIVMAASTLISVLVMAAMIYHLVFAEVVVTSLFRAAIAPFSVVLLAVYYFDVRIRREGYEIEAGLDRLASATSPA
jgi:hypothetical protein